MNKVTLVYVKINDMTFDISDISDMLDTDFVRFKLALRWHQDGITRHIGIGSDYGQFMNDIAIGTTLGFLIIMQGFLIYECIRMKTTVGTHSTDLKTEMGTIGELLDEALDFLSDLPPQPQGIVGSTLGSPDIKSALLEMLMTKMMMPPEHGSTSQQENRPDDEINSTQVETETQPS